ncbi:MAG: asparagine synthase (glutamine-hydrolyzing) [Acidimicrobiales bacterium]
MCGIAGFLGSPDGALLSSMCANIEHRGPDDEGYLERAGVSLGHRRLSVIDIEHGHQPFSNRDATVHLAYNGEVYNYRELRGELEAGGARFETASDTEVVLLAYEAWGRACFERFNGMWALAILDERPEAAGGAAELVLVRDHLGIKPLYLAEAGGRLLFGSEIKALMAEPRLRARVDCDRLAQYLSRGLHDHDDHTFFEGISQVRPGHVVTIDAVTGNRREHRYFEPRLSIRPAPSPGEFREAFVRAVSRRLVADVAVGTCLSGGLDSSAIVVVMSELLSKGAPDASSMGERLRTFSAVFDNDPIDEQEYIAPVLAASGADSEFVRPLAGELLADLPVLVWHQDEPMVSSGPYAQYRVMALAKSKVKVLLDGQGGDELLAGYVPYHYVYLRELARRRALGALWHESLSSLDILFPLARRRVVDKRKKRSVDPAAYCAPLLGDPLRQKAAGDADLRSVSDLKERLAQDLTCYSLPSLLRYEDRNSMAHSIESRPPFLDQELVELVLSLPPEAIIADGWSRSIFREAFSGSLPGKVRLRRKKIGFTTPEITWLRAERARIQGLLRSPSFCSRPYWDGPLVARAFKKVCDGELEESPLFWRLVNVEAWLRVFFGPASLSRLGARPEEGVSLEGAGDAEAAALLGDEAALSWARVRANEGRHVFCCGPDGRAVFARAPVRTPRIEAGDDLERILEDAVLASEGGRLGLNDGDIVAVSEKAVAISQGRSFPVAKVRSGLLARVLCRFVSRSPAGIGLGIPATMQLAIDEAGPARVLLAAVAGAIGRVFGHRGIFYRVAGARVSAIDGPTAGTLAPFDTHAKLPPLEPDEVAESLSARLSASASGHVHVAVVDANDRGVAVLGSSLGVDRSLIAWLFGDNPLGQGAEQTPAALIRYLGRIHPAGARPGPDRGRAVQDEAPDGFGAVQDEAPDGFGAVQDEAPDGFGATVEPDGAPTP